jgi:hypothetical protein
MKIELFILFIGVDFTAHYDSDSSAFGLFGNDAVDALET